MALTGCNFVRHTRHGLQAARSLWPNTHDRFELRRELLKLRFWDERHLHPPGQLVDLSYEAIKALPGKGVYELRIDGQVGGHSNIRIVMFDPPKDWVPLSPEVRPLRLVWILEAVPKRRNEWTANDILRFKNSRLLTAIRCYGRTQ